MSTARLNDSGASNLSSLIIPNSAFASVKPSQPSWYNQGKNETVSTHPVQSTTEDLARSDFDAQQTSVTEQKKKRKRIVKKRKLRKPAPKKRKQIIRRKPIRKRKQQQRRR